MATCPVCGKTAIDANAIWQHMRAVHDRQEANAYWREHIEGHRERSVADELVEAKMQHAMGEPVPDWLLEMFPDEFEGQAP